MGLRNSEIIICKNIKLEKDYRNVLNYTENEMVTLCRTNAVATANNYSFIRKEKRLIKTSFTYSDALKCNYMAFRNSDYSNKWFFVFIDDVEYNNDGTANIHYTVDEFATWFDYWNPDSCLVLREHVNSDVVGEHTYPEKLEHGPYIINDYTEHGGFDVEQCYVVIATTWLPSNTPGLTTTQYYGGVFSGTYYIAFDTYSMATDFINAMDGLGRGDAIVSVFMAPSTLCNPKTGFTASIKSKKTAGDGTSSDYTYTISAYFIGNNYGGVILENDFTVSSPSTLNGYTPKNNKLKVFPYNFLLITNGVGGSAEFHYEDFVNNTPTFKINGALSVGCSVKMYPKNYKKISDTATSHPGFVDGLIGAKFPVCSWKSDSFTNWQTEQAVNRQFAKFGAISQIIGMIASSAEGVGNPTKAYTSLFNQQANYLSQWYQHALVSPQNMGSSNGAEVTFANNEQNFGIYKMSIKTEYARKIDEYMNKFGYQVNEVKLPNQTGRTYWNFVQIGPYENIGYSTNTNMSVPSASMEVINNIYRTGTTIWHSHDNLGNYSLNNTIVSQ